MNLGQGDSVQGRFVFCCFTEVHEARGWEGGWKEGGEGGRVSNCARPWTVGPAGDALSCDQEHVTPPCRPRPAHWHSPPLHCAHSPCSPAEGSGAGTLWESAPQSPEFIFLVIECVVFC